MKPATPVRALLTASPTLLTTAMLSLAPLAAKADDLLGDALAKGKTALELRYRLENVDQTPFTREANASTLRTRVRYTSGEWQQASLMLEMDNVSRVGDDRYNDTRNGKATFPTVVDPDGTDLNQALVKYMGIANTPLTVGRQRVNLDNQRWIGSVGWRQNEQTLDGAVLEYKGIDRFTATYGFITRVNRINGPDAIAAPAANTASELDTEAHVVNLKYVTGEKLAVVAYAYMLDVDRFAAASTQTMGLRFTGAVPVGEMKLGYSAEFAQQSDYARNPGSFSDDYLLGEVTFGKSPLWELQAGYEVLGSDNGRFAVQTPLATLHKFQGWADKFLATPVTGLVDVYVGGSAKVMNTNFSLSWHQYESDAAGTIGVTPVASGADFGEEINAQVAKTFAKRYTVTLKYADYQEGVTVAGRDTTKAWLMAEAKF